MRKYVSDSVEGNAYCSKLFLEGETENENSLLSKIWTVSPAFKQVTLAVSDQKVCFVCSCL